MGKVKITTLKNGLRVITDTIDSMHSVALGVWVGVGTRNEDPRDNGVAHMVEHMLFKGTPKRSASQIAEEVENVGGDINAYTSRELTSYHVHLLKEDVRLGVDIIADMYLNSLLSEGEIDRERDVIIQEIGMCNDTPDDLIFDIYFETAYPGQPIGLPILGRVENIETVKRSQLQAYIKRWYTPENTVISAAGAIDHAEFVKLVEEYFSDFKAAPTEDAPLAIYKGGDLRLDKDLEQSHLVLGFQSFSRLDPDYYTAQALSTLFGGGMSSRLFQEIREKRGLVYTIMSFNAAYQDDGQFGVYAGTGPEKLKDIVPVICDEILKLGQDVSEAELARAKSQMKANILMGRESMMSRADYQAKHLIFRKEALDAQQMIAGIEAVDLDSIRRVCSRIFTTKPTVAALGPLKKLEAYDRIEERLAA